MQAAANDKIIHFLAELAAHLVRLYCGRLGRGEAHRRSSPAGGHDAGEGTQSQRQR